MSTRCFVGIPLPDSYQEIMGEVIREWKGSLRSKISWTKVGNWHITLFFLGSLSEGQIGEIRSALAEVKMERFSLQAGGGGFFPNPKKPRVIWVGLLEGANKSARLADKVLGSLQPLGFEKEKKPFAAHLTLGRIKQARQDDWPNLLHYLNGLSWPEISIDRFVLWKSELRPQGPTYTALQEYSLD